MASVFAAYEIPTFPYRFACQLHVFRLAGGTPSDPKVVEGWLKAKAGFDDTVLLQQAVAETMAARGIDAQTATEELAAVKNLNSFKQTKEGELYFEGRCVKSAIKEAACIRWPKDRWGPSKKGTKSFFAEHVFVEEDIIGLGVSEPTGIATRFVSTWHGSGIQREAFITDAVLDFTVVTDHEFTHEQWAQLWVTGQREGIGSSRSQGNGRYEVTRWEPIEAPRKGRAKAAAR